MINSILKITLFNYIVKGFVVVIGVAITLVIVQIYNIPIEIVFDKFSYFTNIPNFDYNSMTDQEIESIMDQILDKINKFEENNVSSEINSPDSPYSPDKPGKPGKGYNITIFLVLSVVVATTVLLYLI